jgi:hypothetical protein
MLIPHEFEQDMELLMNSDYSRIEASDGVPSDLRACISYP